MRKLRFVALTHDLGKVFDRRNHQKIIVKILKECNIFDPVIIDYLQRFHKRGNGKDYLCLVKYADQFSSEIQRVNAEDFVIPQGKYHRYLVGRFDRELRSHFWTNKADLNKMRNFIAKNQILEEIPSDVRDSTRTSLREHSLLTEQILCLLIDAVELFPCPECLYEWVGLKQVNDYLVKNVKNIPKLRTSKELLKVKRELSGSWIPQRPKFQQAIVKLNSYGWGVDKIAHHFGLLEKEVKCILDS
ncbi:MAG: hypothetical protein GF368_00405 [Candidatus Aenigmarchaeota archaeon]|nr:hypothetical protein [Candidatus Aenigmarchaeota archaeon]